ncbi:GH22426 [Drosophila grimshawi]|uniref:GH22426 n=1 Tax=Drosophila grimshawi TaxID=7222 RepID=B4K1B2_DROGR|nr:GH22426 [Drosophila grimshawi]
MPLQPQPLSSSSQLLDGNEPAAITTTQQLQQQQQHQQQQQQLQHSLPPTTQTASSFASSAASPITPSLIIRKDIHSFNFSDIEVSERPTATLLTELARRSRNGELLHDLSQRAVTATPQPPTTELDDIFISVKTTKNYHDTRLALIIKTWFQLARDQVADGRSRRNCAIYVICSEVDATTTWPSRKDCWIRPRSYCEETLGEYTIP